MKAVKKIITAALALCLTLMSVMGLASCSKPPEYSEIEARFVELVEASYEINKVLFGVGLPTDERIYDPWINIKTYERVDENGEPMLGSTGKPLYGYYSYFEDDAYGELLVYRYGYGKDAVSGYLKVEKLPRDGETAVFQKPEQGKYFYNTDFKEQEGIRYYSDKDPAYYDYVSVDSKYVSIDAIKQAAEQVYSRDYLETSVYEGLFTGVASIDAASNLSGLASRYIEYSDADSEDSTPVLMQSNVYPALVKETRIFDFSTAKVVRPGSKELVNIEVESYLESTPDVRDTVKVTMVKVDGTWYLDSGTY